MAGTLYIVATPLGNLDDMTFRAVRVLGEEAGLIACEDTRHTRKLLEHYSISKPLVSCHEHNEAAETPRLIARLRAGETIALVSDAGTPLVSDPGYRLVAAAIAAGIRVVPIPGPSALVAALSASGLPSDAFSFRGFLPARAGRRRKALENISRETSTVIVYEAPHRILETLSEMEAVLGGRPLVVARELTKIHEEFLRGTAAAIRAELARRPAVKGEITLIIGPASGASPASDAPLAEAVADHQARGLSRMDAIKAVARERGLSKREVYAVLAR